jgi:mono/diheme cytochrome c family protein
MVKSILKQSIKFILPGFVFSFVIAGCSSQDEEIGIGPVKEIKLSAIDKNLVDKGKQIFDTKCASCHKFDTKLVGPPLKDVTKRRKPEWIMNMILNPQQMTQENPAAKELFATYLVQMTFQDVSHDDARALLEYIRALDDGSQTLK